jgi:hypothetical protein
MEGKPKGQMANGEWVRDGRGKGMESALCVMQGALMALVFVGAASLGLL